MIHKASVHMTLRYSVLMTLEQGVLMTLGYSVLMIQESGVLLPLEYPVLPFHKVMSRYEHL